MNLDPFGDPFRLNSGSSTSDLFKKPQSAGARPRPKEKPAEAAEPEAVPLDESGEDEAAEEATEEEAGEKVVLKNPKWEVEQVGFNEETEVSVEAELPESQAHKTKVDFELFAKIPAGDDPVGGQESVSKAQGSIDGGKAKAKVPVYIPQYKDESGTALAKVEYYFTAKHSASDLLEDKAASKVIDSMADREIESSVLDDVTFATDKSFLRAEQAGALKGLTTAIKGWKEKTPDGKLAVFGHADAVGKEDHNKKLSEKRATAVYALLVKDPAPWKTLYNEEKWGLASTQEYLKHLGHDPGAIDGQDGPNTQKAVKSFQASVGMAESGTTDEATREKLYKAFMDDCNAETIAAKDFDAIDGKPHAGCSEYNLIEKTQGASEKNRRVAVFFLKSNKNFPIQYPCKHGDIGPCKKQAARKGERRTPGFTCLFYDQLIKEEKKGGVTPAAGKVKAFVHSTEKELKHFVNISDGPGTGRDIELEVEVDGSITKVFWKATAGAANSKRNDPAPGWVAAGGKDSTPLKGGIGEFESEVKDGKAKAKFCLGYAGGDEFTFEVGSAKGKQELEQKVVVWRRLWFQVTHHKDLSPPSMDTSLKKLKEVFIEWVAETPEKHELAANGSVIVGSHNAADYHKLLKSSHKDQCAHIILCDKQYDGVKSDGSNYTSNNSKNFTKQTDTLKLSAHKLDIFNPPLQKGAKLILEATWSNPATGKSGTLTDDATKLTASIGLAKYVDKDNFEITLPADANPSAAKPVLVAMKVTASNGPWGGDGGTAPHNLIVIKTEDTLHTMCCLHELGHIMNMVSIAGSYKAPPGFKLSDHTLSYTGMGGSGSHCSWEIDTTQSSATKNVDGKCIMFHQLNRNSKLVYCPDCAPFVKAQALLKFHELKG